MIELSRHIEALLLENDCVIVPGLGGFVAHYSSAKWVEEEGVFLPPMRTIGFNQQLTMNDGLLTQSVMQVNETGYGDAMRRIEEAVERLIETLHEEGMADLPNVGELQCSIHGSYTFLPHDNKLTTPYLYGLDSLRISQLPRPAIEPTKKEEMYPKHHTLHLYPARWVAAAAVIVVVFASFFFSTPIENTEVAKGNYAQLVPAELFSQIENRSLLTTAVKVTAPEKKAVTPKRESRKKSRPVAVKEVKVLTKAEKPAVNAAKPVVKAEKPTVNTEKPTANAAKPAVKATPAVKVEKPYHIIVASVGSRQLAEKMAAQLVEQGNANARPIIGDGKMRVCIDSYATHAEATEALNRLRQQPAHQGAWVLKKKLL